MFDRLIETACDKKNVGQYPLYVRRERIASLGKPRFRNGLLDAAERHKKSADKLTA